MGKYICSQLEDLLGLPEPTCYKRRTNMVKSSMEKLGAAVHSYNSALGRQRPEGSAGELSAIDELQVQ